MIILEKIINIFFNLSTFWDRVYVSQFGHRQLTYSIRSLTEHEADECRRHLWKLLVCCALWCPQLPKEQCLQRNDTTAFLLFCETFALLGDFAVVVSHSCLSHFIDVSLKRCSVWKRCHEDSLCQACCLFPWWGLSQGVKSVCSIVYQHPLNVVLFTLSS